MPKPQRTGRVLAVDDEPAMQEWLSILLEHAGYEVRVASTGADAHALTSAWHPDAIVLDLLLPDVTGSELVESIRRIDASVPIVVLTGQGNIQRSVEMVKAGAFDFLEKPVDPDLLIDKIDKAIQQEHLLNENDRLRQGLNDGPVLRGVIGSSNRMRKLYELVACVAPSDANVLIVGENGTGKELIANAIHENSRRSKRPFIKVNCAAIPPELIESELFGAKRGAFTGAAVDKDGLLKMADGGSLLLDEIGEMPSALQTKLLRVLQEREYRPVGGDRMIKVDFRLICATNIDVDAALKEGRLREDLYFRINTVTLRVPSLRERAEDIPLICEHFIEKFSRQYQKLSVTLSADVYRLLARNRWPGNVRELENVIERAILVAKGSEITVADLPEALRVETVESILASPELFVPANQTLAQIEKMAIVQALQQSRGNKLEAARVLGLYRPTLYSKMKKYAIGDMRAQLDGHPEAAQNDAHEVAAGA